MTSHISHFVHQGTSPKYYGVLVALTTGRAGGSLVGESILSRYDRHLILQEIRPHSWSVVFIRETGQTPLVRARGLEPPPRMGLEPKSSAATSYATPAN